MKLLRVLFVFCSLACCVATFADVGLARHKKIYAVPAPGHVTLDGKLDDWDLSGQITMYVVSDTSGVQSAKTAMMYDAEALYISAVVRDPTPMMNRHDPNVDPDKAWDADVTQIFMSLDPKLGYPVNKSSFNHDETPTMCTLMLWYYTDRQEANLEALQAMTFSKPIRPDFPASGVVPRDKFQAQYLMAEDKQGYTLEYRIPWATLGVQTPPRAGDILAATICSFWGTPDGMHTAGGSAWCYDVMNGPGFPYQSSTCWGKIIFSAQGHLPKALVEDDQVLERPAPLEFKYTMPADGQATVQLSTAQGRIVRTLAASAARKAGEVTEKWDGLGDDGKPLPAGSYQWKGLYHQPITTKFILSAHNSGQPPYKTDDNTGGWGGDHGNPTAVAAAPDGMILTWSMSESGWGIIKTDFTGKKRWGLRHNAMDVACDTRCIFVVGDNGYNGASSVKPFDVHDGRLLNWGNGKPVLDPPPGGDEKNDVATGVACGRGKVYVSWTARNLIGIYDAISGNLVASWAAPAPERLAVRADGTVLAISAGQVVLVTAANATPLITTHLDTPRGIAIDAAGVIYVANAGALQNISVFSSAGAYLRSMGKTGGRPRVGRYKANGILEPGGIALDGQGNLWVAETLDSPKRHSVWHTKTGKLAREFFGGSAYFGWAYMDPKHPDELYCHNVLWKVNLTTGACVPWSTIWRPTKENMIADPNPGGYGGHFRVMTAKNGHQYGWGMIDYSPMLFIRAGDVFKPLAGSIRVAFGAFGGGMLYPAMKNIYAKTNAGAFLWQDKNNDQCVQEDELVVSPAGRGETTFNWVDSDLNVYCDAGYLYRPQRIEADGRPVYDFSKREPLPFTGMNTNGTSYIVDEVDHAAYYLAPGSDPGWARYTMDGKLTWGYGNIIPWPNALSQPMVTPGKLWGLTMPLGEAGDFTGVACYFGPYHLFTRDGLYVAMIMRDGRSGGLGADITASEVVTGELVKPEGMNRYFLLAGDQDGRVTEILGLDTVKRLPGGEYTLTAAAVQQAAEALAVYDRNKAKAQRLDIVRGRQAIDYTKGITRPVDAARSFAARTAYDEKNFYVAYEVSSPFPLLNEIPDPKTIFKGGNCLDIQLGIDAQADPLRPTPAPGDIRILITRQANKPVAVLYRPKVKGFTGDPIRLTSGTGSESFDVIETTDRITLDYQPVAGGFKAFVTIPLALLGWTPKPGDTIKMDLGYLFGNAPGSQVSLRAYWVNNGFSANVTYDVPNESRLEPKEWGTANVE